MSEMLILVSCQMIDNITINAIVDIIEIKLHRYGKYNY